MAASYWSSTQRRDWLYTREQLQHVRLELDRDDSASVVRQFPLPEPRLLSLFFHAQLLKLAKRLSLRQIVVATALTYLRRFYIRVSVRQTNPYLVLSTALYIACKIEECPINIRLIVGEARSIWQEFIGPDVASLGECEFWVISTMGCELVVHHPYKTVRMLEGRLGLSGEEAGLAWSVVNDSFLTDLPLLVAPHVVGWAAVFLALTLRPGQMQSLGQAEVVERVAGALKAGGEPGTVGGVGGAGQQGVSGHQGRLHRFLEWLAESEVDIKGVADCMQEVISLYVLWENAFKEKEVRDQIGRLVKGRGLDR